MSTVWRALASCPSHVLRGVVAQVVYDAINGSNGFYNSPVDEACRSLMNVPFTIPSNPELEKSFVAEAAKLGMVRMLQDL